MTQYAELQALSNFSFLRGASHPEELALAASVLGLQGLALADFDSMAGVVRGHLAAKQYDLKFMPATRLNLRDAPSIICLPTDRAAWGRLSRLLTIGKRRAPKGECELYLEDVAAARQGSSFLALQPVVPDPGMTGQLQKLKEVFGDQLWLTVNRHFDGFDEARVTFSDYVEDRLGIPVIASNDVHMHVAARQQLQDVLTCARHHCTIEEAGFRLFPNGERYLKSGDAMAALFPDHPHWLGRTVDIAQSCRFSLDELRYEYPDEDDGSGQTPQERLIRLSWEGAEKRYPHGVPAKVRNNLTHELALIGQLAYAPYFLTVYDIVRFARSQGILCQGRGSAANSSVCFCLGITEVDPAEHDLLFERFVSAARNEPPDIDVDFEHERREEVIQYIYRRYGRERAGLAATVISFRSRSAIREVGKVFGLSEDMIARLSRTVWGIGSNSGVDKEHVREAGLDPDEPRLDTVIDLSRELIGFPRHLSQHVGGFVITRGPLVELSPVANAAMEDRTTIEWDKDDIDALGILKVDVLGLGMLSCLRKGFELLQQHKNIEKGLDSIGHDDPAVYDMLQRADAVGVFQVESRAQMSMLPRLKPRTFYDLVVEVAIVRPGPIQGDMVHPYLRRRSGKERVDYPSDALRQVLSRTHGVPLFQEQAMQIAIVAAGFTPEEADQLRRAMATFRRTGQIGLYRDKFIAGMLDNGYELDFAERCFKQIEGFADYGFPESHAASFAILVYASAWMKKYHPDVFACALLNSQPMGFYAPAQIVRDARDHGVVVRSVDVNHSHWDNILEDLSGGGFGLRLGFRQIKGFAQDDALALIINRPEGGFQDLLMLARQTGLSPMALEKLAEADAFTSLGLTRRDALWAVRRLGHGKSGSLGKKKPPPLPLFDGAASDDGRGHNRQAPAEFGAEAAVVLPPMSPGEEVIEDYLSLRLSLKAHPVELLRPMLQAAGVRPAADLQHMRDGDRLTHAGLAIVRQRPGTAKGVVFLTLEDETGVSNVVVWEKVFKQWRALVMTSPLIGVTGKIQKEESVIHLVAERFVDLSGALDRLTDGGTIGRSSRGHPRNMRLTRRSDGVVGEGSKGQRNEAGGARLRIDSHDFH